LHEWCGRGIAAVGAWRARRTQEQALRPRRTQVERPLPMRLARGLTLAATLGGVVAGSVVVGGGLAIDAATSAVAVSNPDDVVLPVLSERSELFAADGSSLGVVQADDGNRVSVPLDQVPKVVVDAVIATEDARFWVHDGVDLSGVARAARRNVAAGDIEQGGSTITQQLAKSTLEAPKRDLRRKLTEAVLAVRLDDQLEKRAILERYLNTIYFGEGAYGVATAAETYFGRPLADVTVDQAALLAGLIRGPSLYNPLTDPDSARGRRRTVLDRMVGEGYLTVAEADAAHAAPLPMELHHRTPAVGYVADAVQAELLADPRLGDTPEARARLLASGGLRVHTTVDPRLQDEAQQAVTGGLPAGKRLTAALASVEPATGAVRAVVGGPDYGVSQFNAAVTGQGRQTGSAFKVFTLVAALRGGHVSTEQIDGSSPCEIPNPGGTPNPWRPENYEGESSGRVTITDATVHSSNCAFARLAADVGPEAVAATAAAMGVTAPLQKVPSMTLGTNSVPPLQMAAAYATLAADGVARAPHIVERVERRDGSVVVVNDQPGQRVIDEQTARLATSVLTQVVARGTGRAAALGERPVAGKTGTAQNHQDAWFVGYTPQLATAVWMGDVDGEKPMLNVGGINVTGGSYPARIWRRFMAAAHKGLPTTHFSAPAPEAAPPPPPPEPAAPTSPAEETRSSNGKGGGKGKRDR
ncbi:MAG: PBP1A family penicillin-binding protein, partial [Actinomycetota bacterium]|nr:PBP1A family penicillin-binding protein [Actinomycetota bacterium]